MEGGSGRRGTQLRGCPPAFGLRLYAAALSAPSARSCMQGWYSVLKQKALVAEGDAVGDAAGTWGFAKLVSDPNNSCAERHTSQIIHMVLSLRAAGLSLRA